MREIYQKTLKKYVKFKGIGLHTGAISTIKILPAKTNHGVIFKRTDLNKNNIIEAKYYNVTSAKLCTTLENSFGVKVSTVEHLLAALYIIGIDNALIEIDSEEVPIMDGSAKDFLQKLKEVDLEEQSEKRRYLKILKEIELIDKKRKISAKPNQSFKVSFNLKYQNKIIGNQKNAIDFQNDDLENVSNSRTFCLFEDIEKIKKLGLAKGGSLENAIVVDEDKILNKNGLRNDKEFVNHKILDLVGDFVLSGFRFLGSINCHQGGHEFSNQFLKKILKSKNCFEIIELNNHIAPKKNYSQDLEKIAVNA